MIVSSNEKYVYTVTANIIFNGGVAIIPTDTVYGFAVNAFNLQAQRRIYSIKKRDHSKPLILMSHSIHNMKIFVQFSIEAIRLAKKFWPGQLTLILPTTALGKILSGGRDNLGVRIPNNNFILHLLKAINIPIFTTSANISHSHSAKFQSEVFKFEKLVDIIIDGGKCVFAQESTILDAVHFPYTIVRHGCLKITEILKYIL
ncbi:MAG: threonylcarbamoyl-AMP synthase [Endomicrobium sp.]|jgi:L-threonylcarbamoyladenylate synthase|nr:threonylcarbamoyl-AMP synthase [Endomicrobium sp.]